MECSAYIHKDARIHAIKKKRGGIKGEKVHAAYRTCTCRLCVCVCVCAPVCHCASVSSSCSQAITSVPLLFAKRDSFIYDALITACHRVDSVHHKWRTFNSFSCKFSIESTNCPSPLLSSTSYIQFDDVSLSISLSNFSIYFSFLLFPFSLLPLLFLFYFSFKPPERFIR